MTKLKFNQLEKIMSQSIVPEYISVIEVNENLFKQIVSLIKADSFSYCIELGYNEESLLCKSYLRPDLPVRIKSENNFFDAKVGNVSDVTFEGEQFIHRCTLIKLN